MNTANALVASERLGMFTNMLQASGWAPKEFDNGEICSLAPDHSREIVALEYGAGHLHVWDALGAQARLDAFTLSQAD